jgi:REP element-mobilizing transposase RayT
MFFPWERVDMARTNRRDVLADGEIQVVHCINRCVRRAYLCGQDPLTGTDYEHRRELIRSRLEFLAGIMGIEVLGYAIMSNHFHCVLRSRPDVVETWSDADVARKWWMLCPARKNPDGSPAEPTEFELNSIRNDTRGLKEKRVRLSSISWFMRFLSERVAKEANKQDQCSGRFWEGRFRGQILLDSAAILACMQYVDLNPVRANIAKTPEASDFTSAQDRIVDLKSAEEVSTAESQDNRIEHGERAGWLAPIPLEPKRQAVRSKKTVRRASNKGCLSMGPGDYFQLLDWTGRQIRSNKRGAMPANLEPMFERLGISKELWVDCVLNFRKWFRSSVGRPKTMESAAATSGHNRAISINSARRAFAS